MEGYNKKPGNPNNMEKMEQVTGLLNQIVASNDLEAIKALAQQALQLMAVTPKEEAEPKPEETLRGRLQQAAGMGGE